MDRETNRSRGFGFVEMSSEEEANKAIEMFNEKEFAGRNLTVNIAKPKTGRRRQAEKVIRRRRRQPRRIWRKKKFLLNRR